MTIPAVTADLDEVVRALKASWDAETSSDPTWAASDPSRGQCAVSALVIQDEFGGDLIRAVVEGVSHYWNRLPNGSEVDVTRDQFDRWYPIDEAVRDRAYVLSFAETTARYATLRRRVHDRLKVRS
jgi:hypothetical protein